MGKRTTINIDEEVRKAIKDARRYDRETYNETLRRKFKKNLDEVRKKLKSKSEKEYTI